MKKLTLSQQFDRQFNRIMKAATDIGIAHHVQIQKPKHVTSQHVQRLQKVTPKILRQVAEEINRPTPTKVAEELTSHRKIVGTLDQHTFNPLARRIAAAKAAQVRVANEAAMSPEQREALRKKRAERFEKSMANVDRSEAAKKAAQTRKEQGTDVFSNLTPEQRAEAQAKSAETRKERQEAEYYAKQADIVRANFEDYMNKISQGKSIVNDWIYEGQNVGVDYAGTYTAEWHQENANQVIAYFMSLMSALENQPLFQQMMINVVDNQDRLYEIIKYIFYDSDCDQAQLDINMNEINHILFPNDTGKIW